MAPRRWAFRLACALALLAGVRPVTASAPWADARYLSRIPFSLGNQSSHTPSPSHDFATGDVVSVSFPRAAFGGAIPEDGSGAVVYHGDAVLPTKVLVMGGTVKAIFPLAAPLPFGTAPAAEPDYQLYFDAPDVVPAPALPPGVLIWDFSDGGLHGWKSLQDPDGTGGANSDVSITTDAEHGSELRMDTRLYHHPMMYADDMPAMGESTVYARVRTGGGENEAALFQRFRTQTLVDYGDTSYLTGLEATGAGFCVDAWGSQSGPLITTLDPADGSGRRHPGPNYVDSLISYVASPSKSQYLVAATQDKVAPNTLVLGKAWQAGALDADPTGDPAPKGYKMWGNTTSRTNLSLGSGKVAFMQYSTSLYVKWVAAVPNPYAELLDWTIQARESSPGPGPGKALLEGRITSLIYGTPETGLAVKATDSQGATLGTTTSDRDGRYRLLIPAGPTAATVTVSAAGPGIQGHASNPGVIENASFTMDFTVDYLGSVTGTVTDEAGNPVAGAWVGAYLDDRYFRQTDGEGRYTLPLPYGTWPVSAHKDGKLLGGFQWMTVKGAAAADYTLLPAGPSLLSGKTASITSPGGAGTPAAALTDGSTETAWQSGDVSGISPASPLRITFTLSNATIGEVDVHWKHFPGAWRLEMTNSGGTRTYCSAGETSPDETGGYSPASERHVIAMKTAPVMGVSSISIVVSRAADADPLSLFEVAAFAPPPTTVGDAAIAMRIASGLQAAPSDPNAFARWNAHHMDSVINAADAIQLIRDMTQEVKPLRVLVINYVPICEAQGGKTMGQIFGFQNPYTNTANHRVDLQLASHNYLRITLVPQITVDEYPILDNGFRFTDDTFITSWTTRNFPPGTCDYNAIIREFDLARRVDCGDVDEIWLQALPGFAMWETTMAGPNAYWCNSGPVIGDNGTRLFIITGFNYERENDVMLEDWGHRTESILGFKVYGNWNPPAGNETTTWDKFTCYDKAAPGRASCGNVHYPPNGTSDYDYANTSTVSSDADDWLNYPELTGARKMVGRSNWAGPYSWYGSPDYHRNYHIWWYQRMPHAPGIAPDGKQANWWKYVVDMNSYPESR